MRKQYTRFFLGLIPLVALSVTVLIVGVFLIAESFSGGA